VSGDDTATAGGRVTTPALMCVHAHPDDEAISTGGVLLRAAADGVRAAVVTCTGGERGQIVGPGMDPNEIGTRLGEVRLAELRRSLEILGAGEPRLLGYTDSDMVGEPGNDDPTSFWRADVDEAVGRLVAHIRAFRPDVVVTYDAFGVYGHPDHVQAHRVALLAVEACAVGALYPEAGPPWRVHKVYLSTIPRSAIAAANRELAARGLPSPFGEVSEPDELAMGSPDDVIGAEVDVREHLDAKVDALRAHRSQLGEESFFLNVPDDLADRVFGTEWFIRHRSSVATADVESDLLAGLG
jgi:N-acetyl-1-D-myo-inositol-2-amino-2-deoxy-alpha-D-glucopyranoside deacetylase